MSKNQGRTKIGSGRADMLARADIPNYGLSEQCVLSVLCNSLSSAKCHICALLVGKCKCKCLQRTWKVSPNFHPFIKHEPTPNIT